MKVAFDTSVLIAAMLSTHRDHARAVAWLHSVSAGALEGVVSVHALGELWSVLTKLPVSPPISPRTAREAVNDIVTQFEVVPLTVQIYQS
jgi:predicted nucleic acid-binding protein